MTTATMSSKTVSKVSLKDESRAILEDKGFKFVGLLRVNFSEPIEAWVKKYTVGGKEVVEYREITGKGVIEQ